MRLNLGIHRKIWELTRSFLIFFRKYLLKEQILKIYFYPDKPWIWDVIYKISVWNGYQIVASENEADIKMHWEDTTFPSSRTNSDFINSGCNSISKKDVSLKYEKVFARSILVDPRNFDGICLRKSNLNATHDGKIVNCPIPQPETVFVYQSLINNKINSHTVEDIRLCFLNGIILLAYLKYRPAKTRFSDTFTKVKLVRPDEVLTATEIEKLILLCRELKLDYCELDVLRDYPQGTLYVVDANHCPSGPAKQLPFFQKFKAIRIMARAFNKIYNSI